MKTAGTNKKIRELIQAVQEGRLLPRTEFQRRLVWSREDKNLFLDTILRAYPFPLVSKTAFILSDSSRQS
jgi:hypothetical protein